jgi:hypothetical protein
MKPCSVHAINVMRDTFFITAVLSGIILCSILHKIVKETFLSAGLQSVNYLANKVSTSSDNSSVKSLFLSTLATNIFVVCFGTINSS